MKASFHVTESEKGDSIVSVELAVTNEFDALLLKRLASMKQIGLNVQRESMTVLFCERNGGTDGPSRNDDRPA